MNKIEQVLHPDPQAATPVGICPRCGGAVYAPSRACIRCRREKS